MTKKENTDFCDCGHIRFHHNEYLVYGNTACCFCSCSCKKFRKKRVFEQAKAGDILLKTQENNSRNYEI